MLAGGLLGHVPCWSCSGATSSAAGLWLVVAFLLLAGLYALLGAPLVAGAQVLVYIGAISVLILFAVMLTQSKAGPARLVFHHQAWAAALAAIGLAVLLVIVDRRDQPWPLAQPDRTADGRPPTSRYHALHDFVLPFEVVSVLLLAAVIGGVFLAKKRRRAALQTASM